MNDLFAALLLGIIEGITEFLPISSTGHLLIAERWLGHRSDLFNIGIQAGAILAVALIYRQRLWQLLVGLREPDNRDAILEICSFPSTHHEEQPTTLRDYIARMPEGQDAIYYGTGPSRSALAHSPHLEAFRAKGYEVLLLTDPVDEVWVDAVPEFEGKALVSVAKGKVDLGGSVDDEGFAEFLAWMGTTLSCTTAPNACAFSSASWSRTRAAFSNSRLRACSSICFSSRLISLATSFSVMSCAIARANSCFSISLLAAAL